MDELLWAKQVSEKIKSKELKVAERSRGKVPYTTTEDGKFDDHSEDICWWTNGFWGGMMWQLYQATSEPVFKENALELEKKQDANLMNARGMDHDSGFRWLPTSVANYKLHGDKESLNRAILAADNLAGRFNPAASLIRAWNDNGDGDRAGWAIIDCMMNLPLLYWAYQELNDPRYLEIAVMHADRAKEVFIREDGSSNHIVEFNPITGEFVQSFGGQGLGVGSSWTRGQSWALYGFALSYLHTGKKSYLETAERVADYYISCIPDDGLIPVDFKQPADCEWKDSTSAAIAACGLLELENLTEDEEKAKKYHEAAIRLLRALDEKDCNWNEEDDNLLSKCTAAYHDEKHNFPIIYGDYYFIEAIFKLTGEGIFIW